MAGIRINSDRLALRPARACDDRQYETGVDRVAFSEPDIAARRWLVRKLQSAGLDAALDRVGNVLGRALNAPTAVLIARTPTRCEGRAGSMARSA